MNFNLIFLALIEYIVFYKANYGNSLFVLLLQKLVSFEDATGIEFDHVRLLARAFTLRSVGYNNLTL